MHDEVTVICVDGGGRRTIEILRHAWLRTEPHDAPPLSVLLQPSVSCTHACIVDRLQEADNQPMQYA